MSDPTTATRRRPNGRAARAERAATAAPDQPTLGAAPRVQHPCRYTGPVLDRIMAVIDAEAEQRRSDGSLQPHGRLSVIDRFAGTGERVAEHDGFARHRWVGLELEPSFIVRHDWVTPGNAVAVPFGPGSFDVDAASWTFPNGMTDSFVSGEADTSKRHTYSHAARANVGDRTYRLHHDNAGAMGWGRGRHKDGASWQQLHRAVIAEGMRILRPGGLFVIELSNHFTTPAKGKEPVEVDVVGWACEQFEWYGCIPEQMIPVELPRARAAAAGKPVTFRGSNPQRAEVSWLLVWRRP